MGKSHWYDPRPGRRAGIKQVIDTTPIDYVDLNGRPAEMSASDASDGTSETPMVVSPKVLHDEIARQITAAAG